MNHPASIIHQTSACFYKTCRRFLTNVPRESWRLQSYKLRVADFIGYGYASEKRNLQPATFVDFRFSPCAITSQSIDYYIFICIYIIYIIKNKKKEQPYKVAHTEEEKHIIKLKCSPELRVAGCVFNHAFRLPLCPTSNSPKVSDKFHFVPSTPALQSHINTYAPESEQH